MRHTSTQMRWTDRDGTEWTLLAMPPIRELPQRLGFRSREYAFVVILPELDPADELAEEDLQAYVDRALGHAAGGPRTARLWIDPRSRTEWEITGDAGEIVFRRGTEVFRAPRGEGHRHPREMSTEELKEALDHAQGTGD